jgi:peptide/nickel transport system permease protein
MARYLAIRLVQLVIVVVLVTLFSFALLSFVPGDPAVSIVGFADPVKIAQVRHQLNLDQPFVVQYLDWLKGFVHGDMGQKFYGPTGSGPVWTDIKHALPITLELMALAMFFTLSIAIPLGVLAAYRAGTWIDKIISTTAFGLIALPDFALGIILSYAIGVKTGWLPAIYSDSEPRIKNLILPAAALAFGQIAGYLRLLRSDMIATLQEDFVTMARAKGMTDRRILWRHALRPSSLTMLTVAGLNVGALVGGAVVVEVIFGIPGMGLTIANAIGQRQYTEMQSVVAIVAIAYVIVNVIIDLLYAALDPRVRASVMA